MAGHEDTRVSVNRAAAGQRAGVDQSRASRAVLDRAATQDREMTDEERLDMFRMSFFNDQLPALPEIPGFHICWLTTQNPRDTIPMRMRLGYALVKAEEVRGYEHLAVREGAYSGCVMINEMIAAKLPNKLYQAFMAEAHHNQPFSEEEKIRSSVAQMSEGARSKKGRLDIEEGMQDFMNERIRPVPDFLAG